MAQSAQWFLEVVEALFAGMGAPTRDALAQFQEDTGGLEDQDIAFVQLGYGFAPEPITPEYVIKRGPYTNPQAVRQSMEDAAGRGWLEAAAEGRYGLTNKGREAAEGVFALTDRLFGEMEPLPEDKLLRTAALLDKVATQAWELAEPADKWALSWARKFDRGPSAPPLVQVRRRLLDVLAFRDDVHIAAWQPYDVGGQEWEAFTYVWRGDAGTAAELVEQLPYRSYDEAAYAAALQDLAQRGWISEEDGRYVATEKGKKLRQEAEEATDRYFDAAWAALDAAEMQEAKTLLWELAGVLKPPEEEG
jgi:hypothetical protein